MSEARIPVRSAYDAVVDLVERGGLLDHAVALVKKTYAITGKGLVPAPAEPLLHDFRDEALTPRLVPGTDFWREKKAADVVVLGSAFAPGGGPVTRMEVAVTVGGARKRVAVFGRRVVATSRGGVPRFPEPEPFTEVPLSWECAYGGVDPRVPVPEADEPGMRMLLAIDHPGLYPRNPFGKGYAVVRGPLPALELPNLEDPDDLLTPDRLLVEQPSRWWQQPLPWSLGWVHPMMFPRPLFLSPPGDAWFPGPEDASLPEVARGFLPASYRSLPRESEGPHPRFYQEASHGLTFPELTGEEEIVLDGLHPEEPRLAFRLGAARTVRLDLVLEGRRRAVRPSLHHLVLRPAERLASLVFGATAPLPRPFVPGIHKEIPVAVSVDGDAPVPFPAPRPIREELAEARARAVAARGGSS